MTIKRHFFVKITISLCHNIDITWRCYHLNRVLYTGSFFSTLLSVFAQLYATTWQRGPGHIGFRQLVTIYVSGIPLVRFLWLCLCSWCCFLGAGVFFQAGVCDTIGERQVLGTKCVLRPTLTWRGEAFMWWEWWHFSRRHQPEEATRRFWEYELQDFEQNNASFIFNGRGRNTIMRSSFEERCSTMLKLGGQVPNPELKPWYKNM